MKQGASNPPEVPEPSETAKGSGLGYHDNQQDLPRQLPIQNVADGVVADAEHAGHEKADDAQAQRPDCGPPQFVEWKLLELVFHPVEQFAESYGSEAADQPQHQIKRQGTGNGEVHRTHL